jgi:hypothetical protein
MPKSDSSRRRNESDCRYCSFVSKANGEDPIGTAGTVDEWLFVEVSRPWKAEVWESKPEFQPLVEVVERLAANLQRYYKTRLLALVPDKEYTHPEYIRVIYYRRPSQQFSEYTKLEYLIPLPQLANLAEALLFKPKKLVDFESSKQSTGEIREIIVCTHTQYDLACGRFGYPLYKELRERYATSQSNLRVWQTNHFGGHQFAPTLIDFPTGQVWGHLETNVLDCLIYRRGDVSLLRRFYRGWTGLRKFEQIAEREIWMQVGWEWLQYSKSGRILKQEATLWQWLLKKISQLIPVMRLKLLVERWGENAKWSKVQINYINSNGADQGKYEVTVKLKGTVMSKNQSGDDIPLTSVKQYEVKEKLKLLHR